MKIGAYICFVIAVLAGASAINNIIRAANRADAAPEHLAGYAVGALLVPIIFLIGGLMLFKKSKNA